MSRIIIDNGSTRRRRRNRFPGILGTIYELMSMFLSASRLFKRAGRFCKNASSDSDDKKSSSSKSKKTSTKSKK